MRKSTKKNPSDKKRTPQSFRFLCGKQFEKDFEASCRQFYLFPIFASAMGLAFNRPLELMIPTI